MTIPTHILVTDVNKLRRAFPRVIFLTNVLNFTPETPAQLTEKGIPFYFATYNWWTGLYTRVEWTPEEA